MYYTKLPETDILDKQRLDFRLPDFTRIIWASGEPREYWSEKIRKASSDWLKIERLTLQEGLRDSILIFIHKSEVEETKKWCNANGFELILLTSTPTTDSYSSYGNSSRITDDNYSYRAVITKKENVGDWYDAWNGTTDNVKIGKLLGYPDCCCDFFEKHWVEEEWRDLTYPAYVNSGKNADGPIEANILGRWAGIRWVSHMPCSFQCEASVEIGKKTREIAHKFGYKESADTIDEVLGWDMKWSALHGIAEIKTPVYKISAATEATGDELVIERNGKQPEIRASGKEFPFNNKRSRTYTDSKRFENSLDAVYETDLWEDNGFSSKDAMLSLHSPLIDMFDDEESVIDLGSGNGALLQQIRGNTGAYCKGVEINKDAVTRGNKRFERINLEYGDIFDYKYDKKYDTTIFMPGRLIETIPEKREHLINQILDNSKFVVMYMYSDWVERYKTVENLIENHIDMDRLILLSETNKDDVSVAKFQIV